MYISQVMLQNELAFKREEDKAVASWLLPFLSFLNFPTLTADEKVTFLLIKHHKLVEFMSSHLTCTKRKDHLWGKSVNKLIFMRSGNGLHRLYSIIILDTIKDVWKSASMYLKWS